MRSVQCQSKTSITENNEEIIKKIHEEIIEEADVHEIFMNTNHIKKISKTTWTFMLLDNTAAIFSWYVLQYLVLAFMSVSIYECPVYEAETMW